MSESMELIKIGKLTSTGRTVLAITIPGDQVEILGLRKGDPYRIYKDGEQLIVEFPKTAPKGGKKKGAVFE